METVWVLWKSAEVIHMFKSLRQSLYISDLPNARFYFCFRPALVKYLFTRKKKKKKEKPNICIIPKVQLRLINDMPIEESLQSP